MSLETIRDNVHLIEEDLDTLAAVAGGNAYDIPIPGGCGFVTIDVTTVNAIADGTDSVLSLEGGIYNDFGNLVDDLPAGNYVAFQTKTHGPAWITAAAWEYFTSGSSGAKQVDIKTICSTFGMPVVIGNGLKLIVSADDGANDWNNGTTGTLKVRVEVTPVALNQVGGLRLS